MATPRRRSSRGSALRLGIAVVAVLGGVALIALAPGSPLAGRGRAKTAVVHTGADPSVPASAEPAVTHPPLPLRPATVSVRTEGFWSWALMDLRTGAIQGSANLAERNTTASMIKPWLAADYLRRASAAGVTPSPTRMQLLSKMIRDSDNDAAWTMWWELGEAESIRRLIEICRLTDSRPGSRWSLTEVSARDTVRMASCIAGGTAAGPWTTWLLEQMRQVRGDGDFGIRTALPAALAEQTAIKNGWIARPEDGNWHVNCLAIGHGWALSVLQRYPDKLGMTHGKGVCASVTEQLLA